MVLPFLTLIHFSFICLNFQFCSKYNFNRRSNSSKRLPTSKWLSSSGIKAQVEVEIFVCFSFLLFSSVYFFFFFISISFFHFLSILSLSNFVSSFCPENYTKESSLKAGKKKNRKKIKKVQTLSYFSWTISVCVFFAS